MENKRFVVNDAIKECFIVCFYRVPLFHSCQSLLARALFQKAYPHNAADLPLDQAPEHVGNARWWHCVHYAVHVVQKLPASPTVTEITVTYL